MPHGVDMPGSFQRPGGFDRAPRLAARLGVVAGLGFAAVVPAGCASISYVDPGGARHVVGLVAMTLPPPEASGVEAVALTTFGVSVRAGGASGGQATLGYSRDVLLAAPSNACLDLATPGPCRALAARDGDKARKEP